MQDYTSSMPLRDYQKAAVQKFMASPTKRMLLAWSMGAGKTMGAMAIAESLKAQRILIVCPAVARTVWVKEFKRWGFGDVASIYMTRKSMRNKRSQREALEALYEAPVQVISYNLLPEIDAAPRDLLILDEMHYLRNPLSGVSRISKSYIRNNPKMPVVGLSGTPIPNEIKSIWNPIDTLFPNLLGKPTRTGEVSWDFRTEYMNEVLNEHSFSGISHEGAKIGAGEKLMKKLEPCMHVVTDAEFSKYVPPITTELREVDRTVSHTASAAEFAELRMSEGYQHVALICYHHQLAEDIEYAVNWQKFSKSCNVVRITGHMSPEQRAVALENLKSKPRGVLIATAESIREAISLSFIKAAMVLEWRTTPVQAAQLLGRFARADSESDTVTRIVYVYTSGDRARARLLKDKLDILATIMKGDKKGDVLRALFDAPFDNPIRTHTMFMQAFEMFKPQAAESWDDASES